MSRSLLMMAFGLLLSLQAFATDISVEGFKKRFTLLKDAEGKVTYIKLNRATTRFSIMPFINQIKQDLLLEQAAFMGLNDAEKEAEIDDMLYGMGIDPYAKGTGSEESTRMKESLMNIKNINVEEAFTKLDVKSFWKEFEAKLNEAFLFIDPSVMANLNDARFFYKRQVTYKVVIWALQQAEKHFSNIPILNIATFVIVRSHDMMLEQRFFHHNMLLHYFENVSEEKLGMTKEEVDRSVSSIYEYRIGIDGYLESSHAAKDWLNYGMDKFYAMVRVGNSRAGTWAGSKKVDFGFAERTEDGVRRIYHLHVLAHQYSKKPALAYDYGKPNRVKRNRSLLNLAGVALGFIQMPGWLKGNVDTFLKSMYVQQVRMEGALVGYFESTGDTAMMKSIYAQRSNLYILE